MTSSSSCYPSSISTLGSTRGGSIDILMYHSISALLHLGKSTISCSLGVECIQSSLYILGKLHHTSSCISSTSSVQVSGRICHRPIQTFDSSGTKLDGGFLASYISQHVGRHSLALSLIMDVSVGQVLMGLPCLDLTF